MRSIHRPYQVHIHDASEYTVDGQRPIVCRVSMLASSRVEALFLAVQSIADLPVIDREAWTFRVDDLS